MHYKRVIPCLDVDRGRVVKGTAFVDLRDAGDPVELACRYDAAGADELVFLDITATSDQRGTVVELARRSADDVFIPFTIGGGIRSVADAQAVLDAGADKVSVNSAALARPELIDELAARFGAQCVVVAIDAKKVFQNQGVVRGGRGPSWATAVPVADTGGIGKGTGSDPAPCPRPHPGSHHFGRPSKRAAAAGGAEGASSARPAEGAERWEAYVAGGRTPTGRNAVAWAHEAAQRGAGEILLTSMDRDGSTAGYDLELTAAVAAAVGVPVIASGGAGTLDHLVEALNAGADAVLCASIFHYGQHTVAEVKRHLARAGIPVREATQT